MTPMRSRLPIAGVALLVAACTGGGDSGSSGSVAPLGVVEQVTLVDADNTGSSTVRYLPDELRASGTDYTTDPTRFWVRDDSMEPLETINTILCSVQQTGFDDPSVLNQGPYLALVACEERGGSGNDRGNNQVEYQRFTVDSSRASADAPHVVKCWIEQSYGSQETIIYVRLVISEAPTTANPNGSFELYFKILPASASPSSTDYVERGYLRTVTRNDGQQEFLFRSVAGDVDSPVGVGEDARRTAARLVASADGTEGRAFSEARFAYNNGGGTVTSGSEYHLQFNANYLARKKVDSGSVTKVFDRNAFTRYVYRYGLYDANTEARVERTSGFPIETQGGANGWVDYHGLWFPSSVDVTDGQTLVRRSRLGGDSTNYTAVIVPGRLEKRTREALTLGDIIDEEMEYWSPSNGQPILVAWTGQDLVQLANPSNSGSGWEYLDPAVSIGGQLNAGEFVRFWSRARGDVELIWPNTPANTSPASIWTQATINGASSELSGGDLTLYGYFQPIRGGITQNQIDWANNESPYFDDAMAVNEVKQYSFSATTLLLSQNGADCVALAGVTPSQGSPSEFGIFSGGMVPAQLNNLNEMASASTTYNWVTGTNPWNQLRTVKDGEGQWVSFDPPLRMSYTHDDTGSAFHNRTFQVEWMGQDLHGIPFRQVPGSDYWVPEFNIPSGTQLSDGNTAYKVKQLEGEQVMNEVGNPSAIMTAEGFDLDTTLSAPADVWENPHDDAKPTVTKAPRFVGGEAQQ